MNKWKVALASVIGTSHTERGVECQDYCDHKFLQIGDDEIVVAVVDDGEGSDSNSLEGAELACSYFINEVEIFLSQGKSITDLDREFGEHWLAYIQQRIGDLAATNDRNLRDFACTFLAALVDDESAVFYQIGDGGMVFSPIEREGEFFWALVPEESVYANTTNFITDKSATEKLQYEILSQPVKSLVMFTDGVQGLAVDYRDASPGKPHQPFLRPMLSPLATDTEITVINEKLHLFLNSKEINERTDDDKTIVLISRNETANIKLE